ncbi:hypothetical protein DPMN_181491 [Dreissena polymorpha]|uniref:Uncharacterized protein n=2 Tax=Dreissena polymorpha TaxID=45954 RepID=A0A9D4I3U4_DREPO|nr:hypothetical protein DPMN_181491 [Dreissena polymorpha]
MQQIEKLRNNGRSNIHFLHGSYNEEIQKLLEMRRKINKLLDELETSTAKDMNDGLISLQNLLESDLKKCTRLQDELKQLHEAIQSITDKDTAEFFIAWQKCLNTIKQSETFLKEKSNTADSASTFQFNMDIGQYLYKLTALAMRQSPDQIFSVANKTEYKLEIEPMVIWSRGQINCVGV